MFSADRMYSTLETEHSTSALNMLVVAQLRSLDSARPGSFEQIVEQYRADADHRIRSIQSAGEDDLPRVRSEAHSLKGASAAIGAAAVARLADSIERDADEGKWSAANAAWLRVAFTAAIPQLRSAATG